LDPHGPRIMTALQVVCTSHAAHPLSGTIRRYSFGSRNVEDQGVPALLTLKRAGLSPGTMKCRRTSILRPDAQISAEFSAARVVFHSHGAGARPWWGGA
jgi:hypothetical protein